jgi:uncharacterized protein
MAITVRVTDDPARVLAEAGAFLEGDPVRHNVILTLLHTRVSFPEPGRYWIVDTGGSPVGVVFQSPLDFSATITPMGFDAVEAVVDAIVEQGVNLPGVNGVATTAARFAGQWAERTKSAASPAEGLRIYEVDRVIEARPAAGTGRLARAADRDVLIEYSSAFQHETGNGVGDIATTVDRRLLSDQLWVWDDHEVVSMAGITDPVAGVSRIGPVYTPLRHRNHGYASALTAAVSLIVRARGYRCILYTDLANPISNSIYRSLGYRAVDEGLRYEFG